MLTCIDIITLKKFALGIFRKLEIFITKNRNTTSEGETVTWPLWLKISTGTVSGKGIDRFCKIKNFQTI